MTAAKPGRIAVLGFGNFGTCLAIHLARLGHEVRIWDRNDSVLQHVATHHRNPKYLKEYELPASIIPATMAELGDLQIEAVVVAVPTQAMRSVLTAAPASFRNTSIICAAKGIEVGTEMLPLEIIESCLGKACAARASFLSGPSFAVEVAAKQPTAVSVASHNLDAALHTQALFHSPYFRVYTSTDPIGLEIAGAIKNVIAIAAGGAAGLGFLNNARAALITRGLAEMTRCGVTLGAQAVTFAGLGGVGDLFLTCSSEQSRNFTVGYRMGRGETLATILDTVGSVAEGVSTAQSAYRLSQKLGVSMPITQTVYEVLHEGKPIVEAFQALISRAPKEEHQLG